MNGFTGAGPSPSSARLQAPGIPCVLLCLRDLRGLRGSTALFVSFCSRQGAKHAKKNLTMALNPQRSLRLCVIHPLSFCSSRAETQRAPRRCSQSLHGLKPILPDDRQAFRRSHWADRYDSACVGPPFGSSTSVPNECYRGQMEKSGRTGRRATGIGQKPAAGGQSRDLTLYPTGLYPRSSLFVCGSVGSVPSGPLWLKMQFAVVGWQIQVGGCKCM